MDSTALSSGALLELDALSLTARTRFQATGELSDIDEAISTQKQAIAHTPKSDSNQLVTRLGALATACSVRFSASKHILDIRQSVSCLRTAQRIRDSGVSMLNAIDGELAEALTELGMCLVRRATSQGKVDDLGQAIGVLGQAVDLTPPGDPQAMSGRLGALAIALKKRFQRYGDLEDIHQSIKFQRQACDLHTSDTAAIHRAIGFYNLASSLSARYQAFGDSQDLLQAIESLRITVDTASPTDPNRPTYLLELGGNLKLLFEDDGNVDAVNEAIKVLLEALSLSDESKDVNHPGTLITLAEAYSQRFERFGGSPEEITTSISHVRRALELTPLGHPRRPIRLTSLGRILSVRFGRLGGMAFLQEAVVCHQEAIQLTPVGHPMLPSLYNTLGITLGERYHHGKELGDLQRAILSSRKAVGLAPESDPHFPSYLYNLASSLDIRSGVLRGREDLEEATIAYRKVLSMTPHSHPDYALYQGQVASTLSGQFELGHDLYHLEQSIRLYEDTISLINDQDHIKREVLYNYAGALNLRYRELGMATDLDVIISSLQQVISLVEKTDPQAVEYHCSLADAFRRRFEAQGCMEDLQGVASHFRLAALSSGGNPTRRLLAARLWVQHSTILDPRSELDAHAVVVEIIAFLAGLDKGVEERHSSLARLTRHARGAVRAASSAALKHGSVEKALEWLEQGRCLVWRQIHNLRTPIGDLELKHPELARHFSSLSVQLEKHHVSVMPTPSEASTSNGVMEHFGTILRFSNEGELHRRMKLVQDWESFLQTVREKDGFESFLRPMPILDTLGKLPRDGHTIVLNGCDDRADAVIISPGGGQPQSIRLSKFSVWQGEMMFRRLQNFLKKSGARGPNPDGEEEDVGEEEPDGTNRAVKRFRSKSNKDNIKWVLMELWECVVKPIVAHLQLKPSSNAAERTRIWWCVTGPLAFLPIHAAGIYGDEKTAQLGEALVDYAVSSYTPNLAALAQRTRGQHGPAFQPGSRGLLIVSHSDAPGLDSIPGTRAEASAIRTVAEQGVSTGPTSVVHLENQSATVEGVKRQISSSKFDAVHFACHANQDFDRPMQSGFYLEDGKLALGDIIGRQGEPGGENPPNLAFLSACETGTGSMKLSEEAVHLVAGMLAAGYRGVVGTTWSIPDVHAPYIAEEFYKRYLGTEGGDAAYALHCATESLRERLGDSDASYLAWVPFVHFGM